MSDAGPSPDDDTELSIRTIMEQQRIIDTLREIIAALKTRVSTLEAAAADSHSPLTTTPNNNNNSNSNNTSITITQKHTAQEETLARLTRSVAELTSERDAAVAQCTSLRTSVAEAVACCRRLQQADEAARTSRSLLNFVEARCCETELRCRRLEEELDAASLERARWKALATSLVTRLDDATRQRAMLHITALEREERTRAAVSIGTTSPGILIGGGEDAPPRRAASPDALELTALWSSRRTAPAPPTTANNTTTTNVLQLPRCEGHNGDARNTHSNTVSTLITLPNNTNNSTMTTFNRGSGVRRKGKRFLVPL